MVNHPDGREELLRGAGKDATDLFNEVHRWVNIESMLSKCVVGKLLPSFIKPVLPSVINLKNGVMEQISKPGNRVQVPRPAAKPLPTFDWFQTPDIVSLCVYTKTSNLQPYDVAFDLTPLTFTGYINTSAGVFKINLSFFNKVVPECTPKILVRTGKVEFVVPKCTKQLWPSYGKAEIHHCQILNTQVWIKSKLIHREKLNHNTWSLSLQLDDSFKCNVPVGGHVSLRIDEKISAKYTPLISSIFGSESVPDMSNKLHFIIKVYPKGNFTSRLKDIQLDQVVMVSLPESPFGIQKIEGRQKLLCLAAGTGITPMVRLVREALNRDSFKEVKIIFWNRTEADMLLNEEFNLLATQDPRFHVTHVLTSPSEKWRGSAGRVNKKQIEEFLGTTDQSFTCICGPTDFTTSCIKYLSELHYPESSIYAFLG
ncbi:cytochrome b5 reductase 4-like isoform X2 [Artemia franciscana]|uniref:cytochrome b5 reductase 4-like isoform X2 n=1 Tax=Artemia franciscana TaxID=6661 RepID=UPI0032DB8195